MASTPAIAYEVTWPDGDIYANRDGEVRLSEAEARATAPVIGGTWRAAVTPPHDLLCFYKLTCTHEIAKRGEWEPGTDLDCREGGRLHRGAVIRRARARKLSGED
jgi:hypothetical protein